MNCSDLLKNTQNGYIYFLEKLFGKKKTLLFKAAHQVQLTVPSGNVRAIFKEIYLDDMYDLSFFKNHLPAHPKIVDIGANVGYFDTFIFANFPQAEIFAFEPLPLNFKLLEDNKNLNPQKNWKLIPEAVSNQVGEMKLYFNDNTEFSPIASLKADFETQNDHHIEVKTTTLEAVFQEHQLDSIDLLKLDCEGAEYDILYATPSDLFQNIRTIVMETHDREAENENHQALKKMLQRVGYQVKDNPQNMIWAWRS